MRKKRNCLILAAVITVSTAAIFLALVYFKIISLTGVWAAKYEIQGVDVSHYQGEIDWQQIQDAPVQFAFIKATEGSSHIDQRFAYNLSLIHI